MRIKETMIRGIGYSSLFKYVTAFRVSPT